MDPLSRRSRPGWKSQLAAEREPPLSLRERAVPRAWCHRCWRSRTATKGFTARGSNASRPAAHIRAASGSSGSVAVIRRTASDGPVSWQSGLSPRHPFRPCGIVSELVTKLPTAVISVCRQSGPARMFAGRWQVIWAVCRAMWAAEGGCCQLIRAENGDVCRSGDGCLQTVTSILGSEQ